MRFLCITPKSDNWFYAASLNDPEFIEANLRFAGRYDDRDTSNESKTVYGTAAIHLAGMFGNQQIVQLLYEKEHNLRTKAPIKIQTPLLPNATAFYLSSGQDVLHIALARANFTIAKQVLIFCYQNPYNSVIGNIDDDGHSHLMILAYFPYTSEVEDMLEQRLLLSEFSSCVYGRGFLAICCQMGRDEHFYCMVKRAAQSKYIMEHLFLQLTSVHKQKTIFDFLRQPLNFEKCSSSSDSRHKCSEYVQKLLPMALRYLQRDGKTYGMHLSEFFKHCYEKIDIESPDIDLSTFGDDAQQIYYERLEDAKEADVQQEKERSPQPTYQDEVGYSGEATEDIKPDYGEQKREEGPTVSD